MKFLYSKKTFKPYGFNLKDFFILNFNIFNKDKDLIKKSHKYFENKLELFILIGFIGFHIFSIYFVSGIIFFIYFLLDTKMSNFEFNLYLIIIILFSLVSFSKFYFKFLIFYSISLTLEEIMNLRQEFNKYCILEIGLKFNKYNQILCELENTYEIMFYDYNKLINFINSYKIEEFVLNEVVNHIGYKEKIEINNYLKKYNC